MDDKKEEKAEKLLTDRLRENPWIIATIVLALFSLVLLVLALKGGFTGNVISQDDIGTQAVDYINNQLLQGKETVTLASVEEESGLYLVNVNYNGQQIPTYFTKDGKNFVEGSLVPLAGSAETASSAPQEVPKSDKPVVELFVMSYCPYGLEAEKNILPVINMLKNKADIKIRFVHYIMHGEKENTENFRQICIREQQSAKFNDYLACFLEDNDAARCLKKLGIAVDACMTSKAKEFYAVDSALSNKYGVQGSPTMIINGVQSSAVYKYDPEAYKEAICSAFNEVPAECSQTLGAVSAAPVSGSCGA